MWYRKSIYLTLLILLVTAGIYTQGQTKSFAIQVASVMTESEADAVILELKTKSLKPYKVLTDITGIGTRYRIRLGQFKTYEEARIVAERYRSRGLISEYFVATYDPPMAAAPVTPEKLDKQEKVEMTEKNRQADEVVQPEANKPEPVVSEIRKAELEPAQYKEIHDISLRTVKKATPLSLPALDIENSNWKMAGTDTALNRNLTAIFFVDSVTGWAAGDGGVLLKTTDGGLTWKSQISGTNADISFIQFIDWNTGWMVAEPNRHRYEVSGESGEKVLLMTKDGGRSWEKTGIPDVTKLFFTDKDNGWGVGQNAMVIRTEDGGKTWTHAPGIEDLIGLPIESTTYNYGFSDIQFLNSERGWMTGNFYGRAKSNIGGLYETFDGGLSWNRVPLTLKTRYSSGRFTPGLLQSVHFRDERNGSLTGEMYDGELRYFFVLHTTDGGKTWEQFNTAGRAEHRTQFPDARNGWTAAMAHREGSAEPVSFDSYIMRTDNGGLSWQNHLKAPDRRIRALFFISSHKGWAVGDKGIILRYDDRSQND